MSSVVFVRSRVSQRGFSERLVFWTPREAKKASERERERKSAKERAHRKKDRHRRRKTQKDGERQRVEF